MKVFKIFFIFVTIFLFNWLAYTEEDVEEVISNINDRSPFFIEKVRYIETTTCLEKKQEVKDEYLNIIIIKAEAVIEKHFSCVATYDKKLDQLRNIDDVLIEPNKEEEEEGVEETYCRKDLKNAIEYLVMGDCDSVEVYSDKEEESKNIKMWGVIVFKAEVSYVKGTDRLIYYRRDSAFSGLTPRKVV